VLRDTSDAPLLVYRFDPRELRTDRHFAVVVDTCPLTSDAELGVDATMPVHRHGMNYKPKVVREAANRWRAEGLLLHMPGQWEFRFEIRDGGRTQRVADSIEVE